MIGTVTEIIQIYYQNNASHRFHPNEYHSTYHSNYESLEEDIYWGKKTKVQCLYYR